MKIIFQGVLLLILALFAEASSTAQNVFVTGQGNIIKMTPAGAQSTFASGLGSPLQLAFNRVGNLFVITTDGSVFEYTPDRQQTTFASGLDSPQALAFDNSDNLFVSQLNGDIIEITTNGTQSAFAFGF